jgi:hypothetical protein
MFELPEDAREPELAQLLAYWREKSPPGRLPGRQHIDPTEIPPRLLPRLMLVELELQDAKQRFRFRLIGTALVDLMGRDLTGGFVDELGSPGQVKPVIDALLAVVSRGEPVYLAGPLTLPRKEFTYVKRLAVPLARDGRTVDMALIALVPIARSPAAD